MMQENRSSNYTDISSIKKEVEESKNLFKKYNKAYYEEFLFQTTGKNIFDLSSSNI